MKQENFIYSFKSSKPLNEVFAQLLDVRQWWSGLFEETITGKSEKPGDEFTFKAGGGIHTTTQKIIELVPAKTIVWLVTESNLTFLKEPEEWKGTKFRFDLLAEGKNTTVTFTHDGLLPGIECYNDCSAGWTGYLDNLKKVLK